MAISKNNKLEAVIISIEEYERIIQAYEEMENMEITKIIEKQSSTPKAEYLTLEELTKNRGIKLDEL